MPDLDLAGVLGFREDEISERSQTLRGFLMYVTQVKLKKVLYTYSRFQRIVIDDNLVISYKLMLQDVCFQFTERAFVKLHLSVLQE